MDKNKIKDAIAREVEQSGGIELSALCELDSMKPVVAEKISVTELVDEMLDEGHSILMLQYQAPGETDHRGFLISNRSRGVYVRGY